MNKHKKLICILGVIPVVFVILLGCIWLQKSKRTHETIDDDNVGLHLDTGEKISTFLSDESYQSLATDEKKTAIIDYLSSLNEVESDSITLGTDGYVFYSYIDNTSAVISIESRSSYELGGSDKEITFNPSPNYIEDVTICQLHTSDFGEMKSEEIFISGVPSVLVLDSFGEAPDELMTEISDSWFDLHINCTYDSNVTLEELSSEISKYDMSIFFMHGGYSEDYMNQHSNVTDPHLIFTNDTTNAQESVAFFEDLLKGIVLTNPSDDGSVYYVVTSDFFQKYYRDPQILKESIIFLGSCKSYYYGDGLVSSFGAKCVIAPTETVSNLYFYAMINDFVYKMAQGENVDNAISYAKNQNGLHEAEFMEELYLKIFGRKYSKETAAEDYKASGIRDVDYAKISSFMLEQHGKNPEFRIYGDVQATLVKLTQEAYDIIVEIKKQNETGKIIGYVVDSSNQNPISEAAVIAVDEIGNEYTALTDEEGHFELILPEGKYAVKISKDEYKEMTLPDTYDVASETVITLQDKIELQPDPLVLYKEVLDMFYDNISNKWNNYKGMQGMAGLINNNDIQTVSYEWYEQGWSISEGSNLSKTGYQFIDVNQDGIDELAVGAISDYDGSSYLIELYTIYNNQIIHLASSMTRDSFSLCSDKSISEYGSSGAAYGETTYYHIENGAMNAFEAYKYDRWEDKNNPYFYSNSPSIITGEGYQYYKFNNWKHISESEYRNDGHDALKLHFIPFSDYKANTKADNTDRSDRDNSAEYQSGQSYAFSGVVQRFTGYDAQNRPEDCYELILDQPISFWSETFNNEYSCNSLQLAGTDSSIDRYVGKNVAISGELFEAHTAHHHRDGLILIESISELTSSDNSSSNTKITILDSGNCGNNLTWVLKSDGTLTISGNGAIKDYGSNAIYSDSNYQNSLNSPWYQYNESIKKVFIESGVTSIGTYAFDKCCASEITLPDTLMSIKQSAFKNCGNIRSIRIPDSVTFIDAIAFSGCTLLTNITISTNIEQCACSAFDNTGWYNSQPDGVLYIGTIVLGYKGKTSELRSATASPNGYVEINCAIYSYPDVTIREGTTCIASFAFSGCHGLTRIVIPDSVKYIGLGAFMNCISLETAVIGNGIRKIEYGSFSNCHSLSNVYLSSNLTEITNKPDLVIYPGCEAFDFCSDDITFHCTPGSYAESYASNKSFNVILDN